MWQGPRHRNTFGIHYDSQENHLKRQIYNKKVSHNFRHTQQCFFLLFTLTAVATTEPLGGLSLYLGVPATKITIAMAREKARRMTGNKLELIDETIQATLLQ